MKPNILLITTDQQRFDTIAALGNDTIYTPHLDYLVDEGITFTRCYSSAPICMPARATIMNGLEGYTVNYTGNSSENYPLSKYPTLPELLTQNGYQTRAQGKMHFLPMRANYGFEHMELPSDFFREMHGINKGTYSAANNFKQHGVGENETEPVISNANEVDTLTHWTVRRTVDFLETRDDTRPFFVWTSFTKPHPPFDPLMNYWQLYANREMPAPVNGDWNEDESKEAYMEPTYGLNHNSSNSEEKLKEIKKAYYACITQIDYNLGLLFGRLREMDLFKNTWIIFTADHGDMLGDHHMGAKTHHLEGSAHIPCIIRAPFGIPWQQSPLFGLKCDKLVQLSDVFATILSIADVEIPEKCDGVNLLEYIKNDDERIFYGKSVDNFYCVIEGYTKYCWSTYGGQELLFDLSIDPMEQHDLCNTKSELLSRMRSLFAEFLRKHEPELLVNGVPAATKEVKKREDAFKWPGFHTTRFDCDVLH
ncbi:MAG: sulfatase-like hydrolase/transferase [Bacillota bacterium]